MNRVLTALCILAGVLGVLVSAPAAAAPPIDQAGWNARKQTIKLPNGVTLAYVELGDPNGSPVLLLHGWTDNSRAWSLLASQLMKHRLIIPDQRGHGASDKPACCYSLSAFAHDAMLLLDAKSIRRASVVGHSLGSMVGQLIAAEHPERVEKLVLMGSTALVPIKRGDWLWAEVAALKAAPAMSSDFFRNWSPAASPTPVDRAFLAHYEPEIAAVPLQVWKGIPHEVLDVPVGRYAADIKAPTLILSGGKDPLFPPEHHAALVRAIPHANAQIFPEFGHNFNMERPEEVGPVLARFVALTP
jgi:pimeloyl-ACP methyl ester carboxylesterase